KIENTDLYSAIDSLKVEAKRKNISLSVQLPKRTPTLITSSELTHIINTLLTNAISFTPEHGTVGATLSQTGRHLALVVTDNGTGISKKKISALMQPFSRGTSHETYNYEGLGL